MRIDETETRPARRQGRLGPRALMRQMLGVDWAPADNDQSSADADQTSSDTDQTASGVDQASAERDQDASDNDQATADRDRAARLDWTGTDSSAYEASRAERATGSVRRLETRRARAAAAGDRDRTGTRRDRNADVRDRDGRARDARTAVMAATEVGSTAALSQQLEDLRAQAAADRARAAADRVRAAQERAEFARERSRLEAELHSAHLDDLTGAYRREMGHLALSHEIDRARRSGRQFVVAFVDVDRLKLINDRDGHAAGDRILQTVVDAIRTRLRSFDPIVRYGGDEFVCGLGGTDLAEAAARFESIGVAIEAAAGIGISVGLTALADGDTVDQLTERADAAMLEVKAAHHAIC
jgi:diguanylate cyclase (GGDEF)-like protein